MLDWLKIVGILACLFATSVAEGERSMGYRVYLNFWTVESVEGGVERVNLTDPLVLGTCMDGYLPIPGTKLCGKDLKVLAKRDPVWFPDAKTIEVDVRYEMVGGMIRPYIPLNWGQYEIAVGSFELHPTADPLGELEYGFTAVLKLKNFGDDVIEVIGRETSEPFSVEGRNPPMSVNIEIVMEPRSQPRAQL